ncbi:hypothetical protein [Metabacillus fastidiosus]|uniref:hypothetical protein n=1 Tax=Metabacillus fastidiosus TaxID=1458 RepID=UPI002DBB7E6F|nr:hypothetical protein [Metabacillus fastidiosus]MEC2078359.1 hypothetical protein [Metabacillus fastidiosus]
MFILIRNINGTIETLKDSNSHLDKFFNDFSSAQLLAQKLNKHTNSSTQWSVEKKDLT